jgi:hypothetical protein
MTRPAEALAMAERKVGLLRQLDEAFGTAYGRWPGGAPAWLIDMSAEVEIRMHAAEKRLERLRAERARHLSPAGARP